MKNAIVLVLLAVGGCMAGATNDYWALAHEYVAGPIIDRVVVTVPVVDMNNSFPPPANLPASPEEQKCYRAHQALFNEILDVVYDAGDALLVTSADMFYGFDETTKRPRATFWMHKNGIHACALVPEELLNAVPTPDYGQNDVVVLTFPWHGFSVGTRFVHIAGLDTDDSYGIVYPDHVNSRVIEATLPRTHAVPERKQDAAGARTLFVRLINDLLDRVATCGNGVVIPFLWGGSSFIHRYQENQFYHDAACGVWRRQEDYCPHTGYDSSEFVMRMARMAGIEYPWKTTAALRAQMVPYGPDDLVQEGDLIVFERGIMVINSIERQEVVCAASYATGFGAVCRLALSQRFFGITSFDELLDCYRQGGTVRLCRKDGTFLDDEQAFWLVKLKGKDELS